MTLGGSNVLALLWLPTLAAAGLTAAAALAVGARRQRNELGLLAANGASRWQLRAIVLLQGAGLGLLGGLAGILGGLALTWVAFPVMRTWLTPVTDEHGALLIARFSVRGSDMRWVLAFTVAVALLTALNPALGAARMPVRTSLADRGLPRRPRLWLAVLGIGVALAGIAVQLLAAYLEDRGVLLSGPALVLIGGNGVPVTMRIRVTAPTGSLT